MVNLHTKVCSILKTAEIENAAQEAHWILEDFPDPEKAVAIAEKRAEHIPLQYLLGSWEFYGMRLYVGEGVLIPRADTETLVETVLSELPPDSAPQILDLCTGSGCIALALQKELPRAKICGIDLSESALGYARRNASLLSLPVKLLCGNVLSAELASTFFDIDCIVCNPPYLTEEDMTQLQREVTFEPRTALFGGRDGLDFYRSIIVNWRRTLRSGGLIAFEVGCTQAAAVAEMLQQQGYLHITIQRDLCGVERVVLAHLPQSQAKRKEPSRPWQRQN